MDTTCWAPYSQRNSPEKLAGFNSRPTSRGNQWVVPLSPDQWLAGYFRGGGYVRGMLVDQPPPKKKNTPLKYRWYGTIVDIIFDGHCKQGRCLRRIASSSSSTKKESPKKNTKKIVLMLNSDTFRLKNSGSPTRDSPVLKKSEQN